MAREQKEKSMKYQKGMQRYSKAGDKYREDKGGAFYKGSDGKMYAMDKPTDQPGQQGDSEQGGGNEAKGGSAAAEKSEITEDDFQKSLDELEALTKSNDPQSRKEELLQKAQSGDLSSDERGELFKALGGDVVADEEPEILDEVTKSLDADEGLQKALDVSDYLDGLHGGLRDALQVLAKSVDASDQRQGEFNLVFAKGMHQMGELVKSMGHRLGVIENQPAHAPKSRGVGAPAQGQTLNKGFSGDASSDVELSKSDISATLSEMLHKSVDGGSSGVASCGEDLLVASAKYEGENKISKALLDEVYAFRSQNAH